MMLSKTLFIKSICILLISCAQTDKLDNMDKDISRSKNDTIKMHPLINFVGVQYNLTTVLAEILNVQRNKYPDYKVLLYIKEIKEIQGPANFALVQDTINAIPNYIKDSNGLVLRNNDTNKELTKLYESFMGSNIVAILYYQGSEYGMQWYITNIKEIIKEK